MNVRTEQWLVAGLITLVIALLLWFAWTRQQAPGPEPETVPPTAGESPEATPKYPVRPPIDTEPTDASRLVPLPQLSESDRFFSLELGGLFGADLEELLADEALIEKVVATIDNLPRTRLAERVRPVAAIPGTFVAAGSLENGTLRLSEENYSRYDPLVSLFTSTGVDDMAELYRRYYPLFQEAYEGLGYPDAYFNDRVIEVIDHLLSTPVPDEPPVLTRPHVLFQYADPSLEALSAGQKILLRIGPENAAAVRGRLVELRETLTRTADEL